jgi:hypothetical protein
MIHDDRPSRRLPNPFDHLVEPCDRDVEALADPHICPKALLLHKSLQKRGLRAQQRRQARLASTLL